MRFRSRAVHFPDGVLADPAIYNTSVLPTTANITASPGRSTRHMRGKLAADDDTRDGPEQQQLKKRETSHGDQGAGASHVGGGEE